MIVSIDDLAPEIKKVLTSWGDALNIQVKELREREVIFASRSGRSFTEILLPLVEALGMANPIEPILPEPEQIASICYTSVS